METSKVVMASQFVVSNASRLQKLFIYYARQREGNSEMLGLINLASVILWCREVGNIKKISQDAVECAFQEVSEGEDFIDFDEFQELLKRACNKSGYPLHECKEKLLEARTPDEEDARDQRGIRAALADAYNHFREEYHLSVQNFATWALAVDLDVTMADVRLAHNLLFPNMVNNPKKFIPDYSMDQFLKKLSYTTLINWNVLKRRLAMFTPVVEDVTGAIGESVSVVDTRAIGGANSSKSSGSIQRCLSVGSLDTISTTSSFESFESVHSYTTKKCPYL